MPGPGRPLKRVLSVHQSNENSPLPKRMAPPPVTPTRSKENRRPSNNLGTASPLYGRRPSNQTVNASPLVNSHQFKTPTRHVKNDAAQSTPDCYSKVEMGTPYLGRRGSSTLSTSDNSDVNTDGDGFSVTVAVRVRPFMDREKTDENVKCVITMNGNEVAVSNKYGQPSRFCYDHCFWSMDKTSALYASQDMVYKAVGQPLLHSAFEGYNTCLFAYGQTGSGKSHTIMGSNEERGVIPRFCKELYRRVDDPQEANVQFKVEVSFFEIYNEKIHDLLASTVDKTDKWDRSQPKKTTLRVREHPTQGPYVEGLSTFQANSFSDIHSWIELGNKQRATAATGMNDKSSRSHSVFVIMMTKTKKEFIEGEEHSHSLTSKVNIIDLAGSERCSATNTTGDRLKEGANINRSLMTLGKVISGLSDLSLNPKKKVFIPYRDSVLTWLLRESLGGNSKTAMIATVSPANTHAEETLSTLRYAKQARSIINVAKVNEDPNAKLIRELRAEIEKLKSLGLPTRPDRRNEELRNKEEVERLKQRLADSQKRMVEMEEAWQEKMKDSERRRTQESKEMEKTGVAFKIDNSLPNLVNLNEDPQLSEVLLYILKEGETRIGRCHDNAPNKIHLNSALVEEDHCLLINNNSYISVRPVGEAETFVNGDRVYRTRRLHHGDRVVVGNYYFRFNHPKEVQLGGQRKRQSKHKLDFEFARNELANAQGARLESEVQEARLKTQQEMLKGIEEAKKAAQRELETQRRNFERKIAELQNELKNQSMLGHKKADNFKHQADTKMEALREENRVLKQELEANRRRMELETQAAHRALEQGTQQQSQILVELEKEKARLLKSVERLQAARSERSGRKERGISRLDSTLKKRRDLLQLSMWLQEANNISTKLNQNILFSRHDEQPSASNGTRSEVTVRVNNTKRGLMTFWTLDTFEDKLLQMREAFQGNCNKREIEKIFESSSENWETDFKLDSPIAHRHPSSSCSSRQATSSISSTPSRHALSSLSSSTSSRPNHQSNTTTTTPTGVTTLCLQHLRGSVLRRGVGESGEEETLVDRTVRCLHRLQSATDTMRRWCESRDETFARPGEPTNMDATMFQTTVALDLLCCLSGVWPSVVQRHDDEPHHQGLVRQLEDCSQKLTSQIYEMMQSCENCGNTDIKSASNEIHKNLKFSARLLGELCLITDTPCWSIGEDEDDESERTSKREQIDYNLKQGFLNGADVFVDKSIQEALTAIGQFEMQLRSALQDRNIKGEVKQPAELVLALAISAKILLNKCQDAQLELVSTDGDPGQARPAGYYGRSYARSLGLSGEVHDLKSHIGELYECLMAGWKGQDIDPLHLRRPTEALLEVTNRLPQTASTTELLAASRGQTDTSSLSDASTTSSTDVPGRPTDLVRLASRQLVTHLKALQDYIRVTSRRSRATSDSDVAPLRNKRVRFAEHLNKRAFVSKYTYSDTDTN